MDLRCNGRVTVVLTAAGEEKKIWKKYQRETTKIVQKQRAFQHVFFAVRGLKIEKNPVRIQNFPRRASLRHGVTGVTAT